MKRRKYRRGRQRKNMNDVFVSAIIAAAGSSTRMKSEVPKIFLPLCGKPVLSYSLEAFDRCSRIAEIVLVIRPEDFSRAQALCAGIKTPVKLVQGGETRFESVRRGIGAASDAATHVAIHDAARPLLSQDQLCRVIDDAVAFGAATLSTKMKDTVKFAGEGNRIESTPPRERLYAVQTPQVFEKQRYLEAVRKAGSADYTDDCQLLEKAGIPVVLTPGEYTNLKITTQEDLLFAQAILEKEAPKMLRIGHGYDVHRFADGRKLILGGIEIPYERGLLGHSDADVLLHAVMDALLGAAALGDIGTHFPDTDDRTLGADSFVLFEKTAAILSENGFSIGNIDAMVIAQEPKLMPYVQAMREKIARGAGIAVSAVSVKATTEEGLGFTGRKEGIAAHAVCTVLQG